MLVKPATSNATEDQLEAFKEILSQAAYYLSEQWLIKHRRGATEKEWRELRMRLSTFWQSGGKQFFTRNIDKLVDILILYQDKVEPRSFFDVLIIDFCEKLEHEFDAYYARHEGFILLPSTAAKASAALAKLTFPESGYAQNRVKELEEKLKRDSYVEVYNPSNIQKTLPPTQDHNKGVPTPGINSSVSADTPSCTTACLLSSGAWAWLCLAFCVATLLFGLTTWVAYLHTTPNNSLRDSRKYESFLPSILILGTATLLCFCGAVGFGIKSNLVQIKTEKGNLEPKKQV